MWILVACQTNNTTATNTNVIEPPKLILSDTIVDFGDLKYGEIAKANILLKNVGGQVLDITDIDYTCNCLNIEIPGYEINGNDSVWMSITFDSRGFYGDQLKTVTIVDNTGKKNYIILTSNIINN